MKDGPLVSVIIACKNNEKHVEESLQSIRDQSYKNIELIIVDNFSTDTTFEIARKYADQAYQIGPERSTQFNYGFRRSSGEYIYWVAADFILEPDVILTCVEKMQEGYDALAPHNRSVGHSIWAKVRFVERESYREDRSIVAVRFMRRSVFERVGMLDELLVAGEDYDLHNRIVEGGYRWDHVDAVENHVGEPETIFDVWNKFYYYGRTILRYRKKNKRTARRQLIFFRPSFRKFQRELLRSPGLFTAFYLYLFVKIIAGLSGMIVGPPKSLR